MNLNTRFTAGILAIAVVLSAPEARAQTVTDLTLTVQRVVPVGSLAEPTSMAFLGPDDFLVLEKATGRVRRIVGGVLLPAAVLTVPVNFDSERGLLGIAISHTVPKTVFLYLTEAATTGGSAIANRVYRYDWNPGTGTLVSPTQILNLPVTSGPNHNGGVIALGPPSQYPGVGDGGALYVVIGDLNRNGQMQNNAAGAGPDDTGVIFRLLQNGAAPPDNPFRPYCSVTTTQLCANDAGCPGGQVCRTQVARYYAYGVRNSFGLGIDQATGNLWDTENGPGSMDEVNRIPAGFNSGWTDLMGPDSLDPQGVADLFQMPGFSGSYSDPEFSFNDTNAPTAIVFPRSSSLGLAYDSMAIVGDSNIGQLYAFPLNAQRTGFVLGGVLADLVANDQVEANTVRFGQGFGAVTDLELAPSGDLYVVDYANGTVYRIFGTRPPAIPVFPTGP
jgi:glucose/arabinose dehydrogenase